MFGLSKSKGNYAYTVTRAKAMKSLLIKEDDYNKMLQLSVSELARFASEAGYSKEVTELADKMGGVDLVERATYAYMANTFKALLKGSQGELHTLLAAYLQKWDNWNLKVILRGKSYGLSAEEIRADLVPAGNLSFEDLEKLISLETTEEILAAFSKAESIEIPADLLADYKATGTLGRIEDYIDKFQYVRLVKVIPTNTIPTRMFSEYIRKEIDIRNLETILKLKIEGVDDEKIMEYIIPGGKQIDAKLAKQLVDAQTVKDTFPDLAQLDFYDYIKELVDSGDMTVRDLVLSTKVYEAVEAKKFSKEYPLSILPVIDYMICMENEARNIRTIARGIESGLDRDTIRGLLVI
jgi:V/A-type H+-transporting ATPase subunit C